MTVGEKVLPSNVVGNIVGDYIPQSTLEEWVLQKELSGHTSHDGSGTVYYIGIESLECYLKEWLSHLEYVTLKAALDAALREVQ